MPPRKHWSSGRPSLQAMAGKPKGAQQLIALKHKVAAQASKARSPSFSHGSKSTWQQNKLASIEKVTALLRSKAPVSHEKMA